MEHFARVTIVVDDENVKAATEPRKRRGLHWSADDGDGAPLLDVGGANRQRKDDRKRRAATDAGALGPNRAAVQRHEVTHDREPESDPAVDPRRGRILLAKGFEDVRQELRSDA